MNQLLGFFAPWLISGAVLALCCALPARRVQGYVRNESTDEPILYRLNGLLIFAVVFGLWWLLGFSGVLPWDWLWSHRWSGAAGACVLGGLVSGLVMIGAPQREGSWLRQYYLGRRRNPGLLSGRVDAKMYLYVLGATYLELNLLSFAAHHDALYASDPSPGVVLYVALFTWFLLDYLVFERVHLYTYDLFAERLGFKLIWGCMALYPFFYGVGLWSVADLPNPQAPTWVYALATLVFFAGWMLARGANMQKFYFKTDPERDFLGMFVAKTIEGEGRQILCGGFWGVARHVNYLGEILMATGLALALGRPGEIGPWLYPVFYLFLLIPRERDDDRRCAEKYGALWDEYRSRVPWRIVPGVY